MTFTYSISIFALCAFIYSFISFVLSVCLFISPDTRESPAPVSTLVTTEDMVIMMMDTMADGRKDDSY